MYFPSSTPLYHSTLFPLYSNVQPCGHASRLGMCRQMSLAQAVEEADVTSARASLCYIGISGIWWLRQVGRTHVYAKFPATLEDGVVALSGGVCCASEQTSTRSVNVTWNAQGRLTGTSRKKLSLSTAEGAPVNPVYEFQVWKNNVGIINICIQVCCSAWELCFLSYNLLTIL